MKLRPRHALTLLFPIVLACQTAQAQPKAASQPRELAADVFAVPDLPLSAQQAALVKTEKGYVLRCQLSNSSDDEMTGMRFTLVIDEPYESPRVTLNRTEGFKLKPYETRKVTFQTPIRLRLNSQRRIVLMLDQAVGMHSIWEVVKARDALNAYLSGDYSVVPTVIRVANQIDAPITPRIIY